MLAAASIALLSAGVALAHPTMGHHARQNTDKSTVIIQMFEWNWNSIGEECRNFIGPAGYSHVQVSTPTESIPGWQWWTSYQIVSYNLQSKRGSRDEFRAMVDKCHSAGVKVLVDTVWNHMAGYDSGNGVAGSSYSHYNYPGIYSVYDFHFCGTPGDDIHNWNNRWEVQNCELANLADLKTESEYVRNRLVQHANDILSLGVDGFRIDAAKHVPVEDLNYIISRLNNVNGKNERPFITSEIVGQDSELLPQNWASIGQVSITKSFEKLRGAFVEGKGLSSLQGWENGNGVSSGAASVFVATHDSERGGAGVSLNYKDQAAYTLAHVFTLAYPYGTPTILSSYEFNNNDAGAPNGGYGTCSTSAGQNGFLCQHRWTPVAQMVKFRSVVGNADLNNWQNGNNDQIAFSRGSAGFVAINNSGSNWSTSLKTNLPAGSYCDAIAGGKGLSGCKGTTVTVNNGRINVNVPARSAIAVHIGTKI